MVKSGGSSNAGTGERFAEWVTAVAGVAALSATLVTILSVWLQSKNYRKPLLQRYVIRILLMVPIYSIASWVSLESTAAAFWVDPFRDVYEAFTIYAFFQLLINFMGGERSLIILMHGRAPVSHPWPLSHVLAKVDISDPHTFLAIKRGILQYAWLKPILAVASIIMKATGVYKEGYTSVDSGYFWSGLIYNVSITVSLYALAMFWVCMSDDLKPFRPMPKFLCIKGIIFASYWQGFMLSILVGLGAIPDTPGYSAQNLGAAIQDALICFEMPAFAVLHWYAFSWHDYADATISAARMPVKYALRDAFGPRDLIEDAKETFAGENYEYRYFDAEDDVIAHEESRQRKARMSQGMRYARGGKGKYWLPQPGKSNSKTPLLQAAPADESDGSESPMGRGGAPNGDYGALSTDAGQEPQLDADEERLYTKARALEFGDWNVSETRLSGPQTGRSEDLETDLATQYPVITAHHATREDRLYGAPNVLSASTNRNVLQPTAVNRRRRNERIKDLQNAPDKGKHREPTAAEEAESGSAGHESRGLLGRLRRGSSRSSSSGSAKSDKSQRVDLMVEDEEAEEVERVRARKSGNPRWNNTDVKHFVQTYPEDGDSSKDADDAAQTHTQTAHGTHVATTEEGGTQWSEESEGGKAETQGQDAKRNAMPYEEERNVWD